MAVPVSSDKLPAILRDVFVKLVRGNDRDLTARQLSILLLCQSEPAVWTVRGLAKQLEIAKPAITRAVDRLEFLGLARRLQDPMDRRSVLVAPTPAGKRYVAAIDQLATSVARAA